MSWNTTSELNFIRGLGSYGVSRAQRCKLLAGYLAGLFHRQDWGDIDRGVVIAAAEAALDRERGLEKRKKRKLDKQRKKAPPGEGA